MYIIIPGDILNTGMGDHAYKSAFLLLSADHIADSGEGSGDMGSNIFHPACIFIVKLLLGELKPLPAHICKAQVVAIMDIILE